MRVTASRLGFACLSAVGAGLVAGIGAALAQPMPAQPPVPLAGAIMPAGPGAAAPAAVVTRNGFENLSFPDTGEARDASQKFEAIQAYMKDRAADKVPWDLVCDTAQFLLDASSDYFYEPKGPPAADGRNRYVSIKTETNRIIGGFPKEGRQFYQLTFGPPADALLKEAVADGYDKSKLAAVSQRYFHTKAGGQATLLLATINLEAGRFTEAAFGFDRLLARPDSDDLLTPRTLLKAAIAFKRAGDPRHAEAAAKVWEQLERKFPRDGLAVGRKAYSLDDLRAEFARPVEMMFGSLGDDLVAMRYGNPSHTGATAGGTPFLDPAFPPFPMLWRRGEPAGVAAANLWVRDQIETAYKQLNQAKQQVALPGFFPITAPNLVLFRTYDSVCAVIAKDGYTDGKLEYKAGDLLWASKALGGLGTLREEVNNQQSMQVWWQQWQQQHRMSTLAFDNPQVGSLSHDGKLVYCVDDLAVPPPPQVYNPNFGGFPPPGGMIPSGAGSLKVAAEHNKLTAINIANGKVEWELGGPAGSSLTDPTVPDDVRSDAATEQAIFLGPPLPVGGKLYLMFEKDQQLYVACVDPHRILSAQETKPSPRHKDGKPTEETIRTRFPALEWVQKLGSPGVRLSQDSLRRVQPAYLAYADGVMVCPTNCGAMVAVDVNARSLLWARGYTTSPSGNAGNEEFPGRRFGRAVPMQPNPQTLSSDRWRAAAPIIAGGRVIVAAHDANQIQCLDLRTGDLIWADNREANDLYVGGAVGDRVLVVGKESVRAYDLAGDGAGKPKLAWHGVKIGTPTGHGAATREGLYYIPMLGDAERSEPRDPQVWAIDAATGAIKSRTAFRRDDLGVDQQFGTVDVRKQLALGNLAFHDGMMFSQSASQVSAFPLIELKKREMDRLLAQNPNDPTGLADRGELQLDNGKVAEAVADFKRSLANGPPEPIRRKVRQKLYQAYTELLRTDFAAGEPILAEYEELCTVPVDTDDPAEKQRLMDEQVRRRGQFLSLVAKGREKQGRLAEAFQFYREFASLGDNRQLVSIYDEPNGMTRPDVWARGRIDAMLRAAKDPAVRKPLEERVAKDWDAVKASDDLDRLREFVKVFGPYFPAGREAQLLLAEKLLKGTADEDGREAQVLLMQLWAAADEPATEARAVEALARVMIRRGLMEDAVGLYAQLGSKYADAIVRDGKTGADIFNDLIADKRLLPYLEPLRSSAPGKYRIESQQGQMSRPIQTQQFTVTPDGDDFPYYRRNRLTMEMNPNTGTWLLRATDRVTGEERCKFADLASVQTVGGQAPSSYRLAQAQGHLLLLNVGQFAYCFDLSAPTPDGKVGRKLWEFDLFEKNPQPNPSNNHPPQFDPKNPDELVVSYEDGWTLRLGRSAVLQPTYVCLITRSGLVALDPITGAKLWERSNVSPKAQVFGDSRHVFLVETADGSKSRILRAMDGTAVEGAKDFGGLFTSPNRVAVLGRNILMAEKKGAALKALRLYDPLAGKDVWRKEVPDGATLIRTLDPELTGSLTPDGGFEVLSTRTGQTLFQSAIDKNRAADHLKDPTGAAVSPLLLADADRYYLFLNRTAEPTARYGGITWIRNVAVNGAAYAFDRATRKRLWYTEPDGLFRNQSLLIERFDELPVLIAAWNVTDETTRAPTYRVAVLDKQKGMIRYPYNKAFPQGGMVFQTMFNDPQRPKVVKLWRYDIQLSVVPDDDGQPVASAGADDIPPP